MQFLLEFFVAPDMEVRAQFKLRGKKLLARAGEKNFYLWTITKKCGIQWEDKRQWAQTEIQKLKKN